VLGHARAGEFAVARTGEVVADRPLGAGGIQIPARALAEGFVAVGRQAVQVFADAQGGARFGRWAVAADAEAGVRRQGHLQPGGGAAAGGGPAARIGDVIALAREGDLVEGAGRYGRAVRMAQFAGGRDPQTVGEAVARE